MRFSRVSAVIDSSFQSAVLLYYCLKHAEYIFPIYCSVGNKWIESRVKKFLEKTSPDLKDRLVILDLSDVFSLLFALSKTKKLSEIDLAIQLTISAKFSIANQCPTMFVFLRSGVARNVEHLCNTSKHQINIISPFCELSDSEILRMGTELKVPFEYTWDCFRFSEPACGVCDGCKHRIKTFLSCNLRDSLEYEKGSNRRA